MADRVIQRNDTAARWKEVNPVLAMGEIGIETDGAKGYKIGDGVTRWNDLAYPANPTSVVQETGDGEGVVMSQKAVSGKIAELGTKVDLNKSSLDDIYGGVSLFNIDNYTEGIQISDTNEIVSTSDYVVSAPILLNKGQTIKTKVYAYNTSTISLTENVADVSQRSHIGVAKVFGAGGSFIYEYTAIEDCYVEICAYKRYSPMTYTIKNEGEFDVLKERVNSAENNINSTKSKVEDNKKAIEEIYGTINEYTIQEYSENIKVNNSSQLVQEQDYILSAPILLIKGQTIKTSIFAYNTATISLTENIADPNNRSHKMITSVGNAGGRFDYSYTATEDCYVELCAYIKYSPVPNYTIKNDGAFDVLEKKVEGLETQQVGSYSIGTKIYIPNDGVLLLSGASFASMGNGWFENGCKLLNVTSVNKAEDGTSIMTMANKIFNGTMWSNEEFEAMDALVIMHVHNFNVFDGGQLEDSLSDYNLPFNEQEFTDSNYSRAYDYVIRKYRELCYNERTNEASKWYGTYHGKPCQIVLCTHWHDARTTFNNAIRKLSIKWGLPLVKFDENVGFSKNMTSEDGTQISVWYAKANMPESMWTENIGGVTYGWHQDRGADCYIQQKMGYIFANEIK